MQSWEELPPPPPGFFPAHPVNPTPTGAFSVGHADAHPSPPNSVPNPHPCVAPPSAFSNSGTTPIPASKLTPAPSTLAPAVAVSFRVTNGRAPADVDPQLEQAPQYSTGLVWIPDGIVVRGRIPPPDGVVFIDMGPDVVCTLVW